VALGGIGRVRLWIDVDNEDSPIPTLSAKLNVREIYVSVVKPMAAIAEEVQRRLIDARIHEAKRKPKPVGASKSPRK
jgi:hypothetical protein